MKSSKLFLTVIALLSFSVGIQSQDSNQKTQVHLKDGSVLIGEIIEDTDYFIRLATPSLDTMEIGYKYILGIGEGFQAEKKRKVKPPFVQKGSGPFVNFSIGGLDQNAGESNSLRTSLIVGERISKRLNLGFEVGLQELIFTSGFAYGESSFLIVAANAKHYFNEKQHRWFVDGSLGYGFAIGEGDFFQNTHEYKGGVNSMINVGRQWTLNNRLGLFFKAGVGYQHATGNIVQTWDINPVEITYRKEYIYPSFLIGIEF